MARPKWGYVSLKEATLEQKMMHKEAVEKYGVDPEDVSIVRVPGKKGFCLVKADKDDPEEFVRCQMVAKGWAESADEITDEMIDAYEAALEDSDDEALERAKAGLAARRG